VAGQALRRQDENKSGLGRIRTLSQYRAEFAANPPASLTESTAQVLDRIALVVKRRDANPDAA
jgi:hypothetical protein